MKRLTVRTQALWTERERVKDSGAGVGRMLGESVMGLRSE